MGEHTISDRQRAWLMDWQTARILSSEQVDAILARYESAAESNVRKQSRATFVLLSLAALLVGLAVLLLIAYNWNDLPRAAKLVLIFGIVGATYAAAFHLRYRQNARTASEVVFFLASLFYGAAIWLIAQAFHLDAHYPDGVWWWAVGVLPFAVLLDTLLLHGLVVALLALWAGLEIFGFSHLGPWFFGRWIYGANGAYTLPFLALPGVLAAYRKRSAGTISLYAPLLAWWVILQPFAWKLEGSAIFLIGGMGAILILIAESHPPGSRLAVPYRVYGVLLIVGVLMLLSHYGINVDLERATAASWRTMMVTMTILVLLALTLVIGSSVRQYFARLAGLRWRFEDMFRQQALAVVLAVGMAFLCSWNVMVRQVGEGLNSESIPYAPLVPTVAANIALLVLALWLMRLGIVEDRGRPFSAGVAIFLFWAVLRYIDLFGNMGGLLGAAFMFFLCGAALFGLAMYWRNRKEGQHVEFTASR